MSGLRGRGRIALRALLRVFAGVGLALAALPSCSVLGLKRQVEALESRGGVTVQLVPRPGADPPTYALAWRVENGERMDSAGFQKVRGDGIAAFSLELGTVYHVGAFTDENTNGAFDAGEPVGVLAAVEPVPLGEPDVEPRIWKLELDRGHAFPPGTVIEVPRDNPELGGKIDVALGEVASPDDERFQAEAGGLGLWRPLDFLSSNTVGIYFTEPYDAGRTPVVFVYGIGGSPQDWKYFFGRFDRERYQLWFAHYPSGMRLERVAEVLALGLRSLRARTGFDDCYVVAHSMGGLVAKAAICEAAAGEGESFVPKFITISTPWGGHKAAELGVRHLRKPVPSWLDVTPGSDFLVKLYATPLPEGTSHDLTYGSVEDGPFWMRDPNDGVVTVESETDRRVTSAAASVAYLPYGHVEILQQPETVAWVEARLAE